MENLLIWLAGWFIFFAITAYNLDKLFSEPELPNVIYLLFIACMAWPAVVLLPFYGLYRLGKARTR